jgi:hypothetical protein
MEQSAQLYAAVTLPPEKRAPGTQWKGSYVDPRDGLDEEKRKFADPWRETNHSS